MLSLFYNKISEHIDTKMKIKKILIIFLLFFTLLPLLASAAGTFEYTPLEKIPGSDTETGKAIDFYQYVSAVYKFGIWAVGIVALFMLVFGGYTYITSAGNNSSMETAKRIITDAIVGLIMALTAYLLLYVINPDLVKMKKLTPVAGVPVPGVPGVCKPATSVPCAPDNLQKISSCFGSNINNASAICLKESGNNETVPSSTDKCQPGGEPVSWGLFQINLTNHTIGGLDCSKAFSNQYTGGNHNCTVINKTLYDQCVVAAKNPLNNVTVACSISKGGTNWGQWGANTNPKNGCHF